MIAVVARRVGALDGSGAAAAVVAGSAASAAGWPWALLLISYFVAASALSRMGRRVKAARTGGMVEKGGARDWRQVAVNGGPFVLAAGLAAVLGSSSALECFAVGSLAAAAADSWATEVGTLAGGTPRSLAGWRPVPTGTSGGVTLPGTLALVAGALFTALTARAVGFDPVLVTAFAVGGIGGATVDSVLGAVAQARRECPACRTATEQRTHRCGTATILAGGIPWLDNDLVNLACAVSGGVLAVAVNGGLLAVMHAG